LQGNFLGQPVQIVNENNNCRLNFDERIISLGETFEVVMDNRQFSFKFNSIDDLQHPTKAFIGYSGSIRDQYDPSYLEYIRNLIKEKKVSVSLHGVTHHQNHLTSRGAHNYSEFYLPGTKQEMPVEDIIKLIQQGKQELDQVFSRSSDIFTDAFGHPTANTLEALKLLKIAYYPGVEYTLTSPVNFQGNYILGIIHIYFRRFSLVKKYLKYAALNHGIASFAIHGILGNESTYSSLTFSKMIMKFLKKYNYMSLLPGQVLRIYKNIKVL